MATGKKDSKLDTPTARRGLKKRHQPYWTNIGHGLALGYRKGSKGGSWYYRVYVGAGKYGQDDVGAADDHVEANGETVLSFYQAQDRARERAQQHDHKLGIGTGPLTVEKAARNYSAGRESQKYAEADRDRLLARLPDALKTKAVAALNKADVETWRNGLVPSKGSSEDIRRAKDTANRLLNILKAALNHAFEDDKNRIPSDNAWRKVKAFKKVGAPRRDHFTQAQAASLIAAARQDEGDAALADLLEAAYHTGARPPGELAALNVHHFHPELAQLTIPDGKTGSRETTLTKEGVAFFMRLAADKKPRDVLLPRADGQRWGKNHHQKPMFRAIAAAGLPASVTIYTMRHTYISLAGARGMPIQAVAKNVGTSVKMIERHYGKFFSEDFRNLVQKHAPVLHLVGEGKRAA